MYYCNITKLNYNPNLLQASTTKSSKKVPLFFYTLYIEGEGSNDSGEGEVIVRVNIKDVNDNAPMFDTETDEIVASVPTTAQYGHHVTKIEVIVWKLLVLVSCHTPISVSIFNLIDLDDTSFKVPHHSISIFQFHTQQNSDTATHKLFFNLIGNSRQPLINRCYLKSSNSKQPLHFLFPA